LERRAPPEGKRDVVGEIVQRALEIDKTQMKKTSSADRMRTFSAARQKARTSLEATSSEEIDVGGIPLLPAPPPSARAVRSALDYARGLGLVNRCKGGAVALFNAEGKALYDSILKQVRTINRVTGAIPLVDGERSEIIKLLSSMRGGNVRLISVPTKTLKLSGTIQKFADGDQRVVRGFATTGDVDRVADVVIPSGMKVQLPISLLWQHDKNQPIGAVRSAQARPEGVWIEASLVRGVQRADEAWALVQADAVNSFSIGFIGKGKPIANGGMQYDSWTLLEVSIVSVPANPNARIRRSA
jgi:HK97 family phage prohead protease